ncbi:MAG: hypothetical protein OEY52_01550 [Gammaproteobacteria bacterium]|nr:hypothetical protein [Gammaproteobacteria bacterium]
MAHFFGMTEQIVQVKGIDLKLVSRFALYTSIVAVVMLVLSVLFLTDKMGTSYAEIIYAHSFTQKHLKPVLLISGLCLLSFIAFITWLFTIYSTFRIAGPLYRFSRNLEQAAEGIPPIGVRKDDALQDVSDQLKQSVGSLHNHYRAIDKQINELLYQIDIKDESSLDNNLAKLKELLEKARIDG